MDSSALQLLFSRLRDKDTRGLNRGCVAWGWELGCNLMASSQLHLPPQVATLLGLPRTTLVLVEPEEEGGQAELDRGGLAGGHASLGRRV